jgi:hypothetical protein
MKPSGQELTQNSWKRIGLSGQGAQIPLGVVSIEKYLI